MWASEETGHRHLYLVTSQISSYVNGVEEVPEPMEFVHLQPRVVNKVALTSGDWEVLGHNVWVDCERQLVYFLALRESPLEKHLYVVSMDRPGEIRLLTSIGYSYTVDFNKVSLLLLLKSPLILLRLYVQDCTMFVAVYSNIRKLPACQVFRITHCDWTVEGVNVTPLGYLLEPSTLEHSHYCPELHTHEIASGHVLHAMVFKPHDFRPGRKYPTVLNVYGGPEVQLVTNTFKV